MTTSDSPASVLVLGAGRSGTSLVTGCFRHTRHLTGMNLIPPNPANPTGYYEDYEINRLNNRIIHRLLYPFRSYRLLARFRPPPHRDWRAYWLAAPAAACRLPLPGWIRREVIDATARAPFCYKDPRFCLTLPAWRPYLPAGTRHLVVFRDFLRTADSVVRHAQENYDPPLAIDRAWALRCWNASYRRLLRWARGDRERWMFVDADAVVDGSARAALESFVGLDLDFTHIDPALGRSRPITAENDALVTDCRHLFAMLAREARADLARGNTPPPAGAPAAATRSPTSR